jgi:hypothetical protein
MMRRLYADADQYLPEPNANTSSYYMKPDYSKRSLLKHYKAGEKIITRDLRSARFNWTEPLEMVLDVSALPNRSDRNSLKKARGKMLVMKDRFAGFELAWVSNYVNSTGKPERVLFLEQHKMQMGTNPEDLLALMENMKLALAEAKAANWDLKNVVYVVKSTRPLLGGRFRSAIHALPKQIGAQVMQVVHSTNVVFLCGKDGLGEYLGPMLWGSLTASDALGPVVSSQDGDAAGHDDDEEEEEEEEEEE